MLRGKQLDDEIEKELQLMLIDGFDKSPISPKALHDRLIRKGYISGGLSTLSSINRKRLINIYTSKQIEELSLREKDKQNFVNRKTRQALINTNTYLREQIGVLEDQLDQNTNTLMSIIDEVKLRTNLKVDHLLAPHLLKKYLERE